MEFERLSNFEEELATAVVDASYRIHKALGPGLLEKIYEACLVYELEKVGYNVRRQVVLPIEYDGHLLNESLRIDLLLEEKIIIETKAVEEVNPVWQAQILSYLKLTNLRLGLLINFNVPTIKSGIKRIIR